jgi:hypothetical protein
MKTRNIQYENVEIMQQYEKIAVAVAGVCGSESRRRKNIFYNSFTFHPYTHSHTELCSHESKNEKNKFLPT